MNVAVHVSKPLAEGQRMPTFFQRFVDLASWQTLSVLPIRAVNRSVRAMNAMLGPSGPGNSQCSARPQAVRSGRHNRYSRQID